MLKLILGRLICLLVASILVGCLFLMVSYTPVRDGKLYLNRALGQATLLREGENGIHHIRADSLQVAIYA